MICAFGSLFCLLRLLRCLKLYFYVIWLYLFSALSSAIVIILIKLIVDGMNRLMLNLSHVQKLVRLIYIDPLYSAFKIYVNLFGQ
jgi:hypothetical protein